MDTVLSHNAMRKVNEGNHHRLKQLKPIVDDGETAEETAPGTL